MSDVCKICGCDKLSIRGHTARCSACGVLLYYPYPDETELAHCDAEAAPEWYAKSAAYNHANFTRMVRFATKGLDTGESWRVLDYGCGGGQFALIAKSLFPFSQIFCTDISDGALLADWRTSQTQIPFLDFPRNQIRFDLIFLNDALEHVYDPQYVLKLLASKLRPGGKIFIDTPKSFWLYPVTRILNKRLHNKLLQGTVSLAHLQIWSRRAFIKTIADADLQVLNYREISEFTMPADYYLNNMGIENGLVRLVGVTFYSQAKFLARNKIMALVSPRTPVI